MEKVKHKFSASNRSLNFNNKDEKVKSFRVMPETEQSKVEDIL